MHIKIHIELLDDNGGHMVNTMETGATDKTDAEFLINRAAFSLAESVKRMMDNPVFLPITPPLELKSTPLDQDNPLAAILNNSKFMGTPKGPYEATFGNGSTVAIIPPRDFADQVRGTVFPEIRANTNGDMFVHGIPDAPPKEEPKPETATVPFEETKTE